MLIYGYSDISGFFKPLKNKQITMWGGACVNLLGSFNVRPYCLSAQDGRPKDEGLLGDADSSHLGTIHSRLKPRKCLPSAHSVTFLLTSLPNFHMF